MYKRINILGAAGGWETVPYDDGELWAVNNSHVHMDRPIDLVIDIHNHCLHPELEKDKQSLEFIKGRGITLIAREVIDGIKSRKYPLEEIRKEFCDTDYFGSGIDYMIALAIYEKATEIHIYGVQMMKGSEYHHQKPSVEYWCGVANGRGISVTVHGYYSTILKTRNYMMYGYDLPQEFAKKYHPEQIKLLKVLGDIIERQEKCESASSTTQTADLRKNST